MVESQQIERLRDWELKDILGNIVRICLLIHERLRVLLSGREFTQHVQKLGLHP